MVQPASEETGSQQQVPKPDDKEAFKKSLADEKAKADANLAGWQRAKAAPG